MLPIVVRYYRMADSAWHKTEEQKEFLMDTQDIVKEWERQLRQEGRQEAAAEIRPVLLRLYGFRFSAVPEQVHSRIEAESDLAQLAAWTELIVREPQEVVDRVLCSAGRDSLPCESSQTEAGGGDFGAGLW